LKKPRASSDVQIAYPNFSVYHATKWGIEGFVEAVAQEAAPFQIACMIVEPYGLPIRFLRFGSPDIFSVGAQEAPEGHL
jgi:NAD(P)-dependent dehydrogenase (short-subunit alcohol dehydrogenase family)